MVGFLAFKASRNLLFRSSAIVGDRRLSLFEPSLTMSNDVADDPPLHDVPERPLRDDGVLLDSDGDSIPDLVDADDTPPPRSVTVSPVPPAPTLPWPRPSSPDAVRLGDPYILLTQAMRRLFALRMELRDLLLYIETLSRLARQDIPSTRPLL